MLSHQMVVGFNAEISLFFLKQVLFLSGKILKYEPTTLPIDLEQASWGNDHNNIIIINFVN